MAVRNKELDIYTATKIVFKGGKEAGVEGDKKQNKDYSTPFR